MSDEETIKSSSLSSWMEGLTGYSTLLPPWLGTLGDWESLDDRHKAGDQLANQRLACLANQHESTEDETDVLLIYMTRG